MNRQVKLRELLSVLFSPEELRLHLACEKDGEEIVRALPGSGASAATLLAESVDILARRGMIDREFFENLEAARPRRVKMIYEVRRIWLCHAKLDRGEMWAEGRYRLLSPCGNGGFGLVWKAVECQTGQHVALKILLEHLADNRSIRQRFFRGASVLSMLTHPAIVRVRSAVEQEGLRFFYVMELIEGDRLDTLVGKHPLGELLEYLVQIADAIHHVHSHRIIHRDIKPSNILISKGQTKLIDFDLVSGDTFEPMTSRALGTEYFSPPEATSYQSRAETYDVFSLARTVEYVLCGRLPAPEERITCESLGMLDVPLEMKRVLQKAVHPNPGLRTTTVAMFCAEFRAALRGSSFPRDNLRADSAWEPGVTIPDAQQSQGSAPVRDPAFGRLAMVSSTLASYEFLMDERDGLMQPRLLGSGRFGTVYAVRRQTPDNVTKTVAMKILREYLGLKAEHLFRQEISLGRELTTKRAKGITPILDVIDLPPLVMCGCGTLYQPRCPHGCDRLLVRIELKNRPFPGLLCEYCGYQLSAEFSSERGADLYSPEAKPCCKEGNLFARIGIIINFTNREAMVMEMLDQTLFDGLSLNERVEAIAPDPDVMETVLCRLGLLPLAMHKQIVAQKTAALDNVRLMIRICESVAWLHKERVTHKDVAPDNIMIKRGDDGGIEDIQIIDFGLSDKGALTQAWYDDVDLRLTELTKLPYLSPEARYRRQAIGANLEFDRKKRSFRIPMALWHSPASVCVGDVLVDYRAHADNTLTIRHIDARQAFFSEETEIDAQSFYDIVRPLGEAHDVYALGAVFFYVLTGRSDKVEYLGNFIASLQDQPVPLVRRRLRTRDNYYSRLRSIRVPYWREEFLELVVRAMVRGCSESFVTERTARGDPSVARLLTGLRDLEQRIVSNLVVEGRYPRESKRRQFFTLSFVALLIVGAALGLLRTVY